MPGECVLCLRLRFVPFFIIINLTILIAAERKKRQINEKQKKNERGKQTEADSNNEANKRLMTCNFTPSIPALGRSDSVSLFACSYACQSCAFGVQR